MKLESRDLRDWCLERDLVDRLVALVQGHPDDVVPAWELDAVLASADHLPPVPAPRRAPGAERPRPAGPHGSAG